MTTKSTMDAIRDFLESLIQFWINLLCAVRDFIRVNPYDEEPVPYHGD
jgi:hypothetical protein